MEFLKVIIDLLDKGLQVAPGILNAVSDLLKAIGV
ncbi:Uncharacterised protein [Staphylococcus intermedius NCTC 11048]|uniref:Uncharacterized protein n=1 Tax=Staphylococcus intermedius NCTC 11048 TaxID=1141106 RepID=A0A380G008_STAIN|nr:Uncharacterised protein [Staphylococcus intermedius NCTC 11048]